MKILNLYAGIGGNRKLWGNDHQVTAIEYDQATADVYKSYFPNDIVIVTDAHNYLLEHYKDFDFIWSSPPCPSHSRARFWGAGSGKMEALYPDMKLYQEIIFLDNYFKGKYLVENVIPYYEPLIPGKKRGRHLYWSNFNLPKELGGRKYRISGNRDIPNNNEVEKLCAFHGIDLSTYKGDQRKDKIARNLVDYEVGRTILECAMGVIRKQNVQQTSLF